ncbi:hypothetical protein NEIRO03_0276 [Nematocida sp. AWRm78]|nr:hypothetical protein NEIRO02_0277 [Nematocida sp. AWRm79]KAI5182612.1 hypothetical protein NEIRO03_0276 [Nematocida sp. AWRm78]
MPASIGSLLREIFHQRYTEITEQKLSRYRFRLTSSQRLQFYSGISLLALSGFILVYAFSSSVSQIIIDYTHCTEKACEYSFFLDKQKHNTHIYGSVKGAAQTHMKYTRDDSLNKPSPDNINEIDCSPYMQDGKWVYPCGITLSTLPTDSYKLLDENKNEVLLNASMSERISSWSRPSSFLSAYYKIGSIPTLLPGKYQLIINKQLIHPLNVRKVIIISNIGIFGNLFYNSQIYILSTVILLAIINAVACMYYV